MVSLIGASALSRSPAESLCRVKNVADVADLAAEDREKPGQPLDVLEDLSQPLGIASKNRV